MAKTILIVGAGFGQVPAIKKAKELGLKVVTVDRNPDAVGMGLADIAYPVDILNKDEVLEVAKREKIEGVLTLQSDHGVPSVGYVNDQMGLRGVSYQTAMDCSIKSFFRERLAKGNCAQPLFYEVGTKSEALKAIEQLDLPVVVKATDSSGSRGITKVDNLSGLEKAIKEAFSHTRQNTILVEEYIEGIEFGAQTFSVNGKCELVLFHNDKLSPPPYMVPIGHSFPFDGLNGILLKQAENDIKSVVETLGIYDGPANIDVILDIRTQRVKVIEIGARIGATCLPELVYYHTGIDWVEQSIRSALGETPDLKPKQQQPVAARIIESRKDGVFVSFQNNNQPSNQLLEFEITSHAGETVNKLKKGTDRIGKIVCQGQDYKSAENFAEEFHNNLHLQID